MKNEYKYISIQEMQELGCLTEPQLKENLISSMVKIKEVKKARKVDADYISAKGKVKVIEDGYKQMMGLDEEKIDYIMHLLEKKRNEKKN